jgi:hypothetical protein
MDLTARVLRELVVPGSLSVDRIFYGQIVNNRDASKQVL